MKAEAEGALCPENYQTKTVVVFSPQLSDIVCERQSGLLL